jgi:hypothetical protein
MDDTQHLCCCGGGAVRLKSENELPCNGEMNDERDDGNGDLFHYGGVIGSRRMQRRMAGISTNVEMLCLMKRNGRVNETLSCLWTLAGA